MRLATYCLCILGALGGMWLADQGAWASAGAIWVIVILLAIDGGFRAFTKELMRPRKDDPITDQDLAARGESLRQRQRTLSVRGGLPESRAPTPPPPPKKPANPFKLGDHVFVKSVGMDGYVCARTDLGYVKVRAIAGTSASCWYEANECQLISKEQKFKVGDRVRDKGTKITGTITGRMSPEVVIVDFDTNKTGVIGEVWFRVNRLELICEKQS